MGFPRVGQRGGGTGRSGTSLGPPQRPQLHPWATNRFANWWARSWRKCPWCAVRASPSPLLWSTQKASRAPVFSEEGGAEKHPQLCRSPPFAPVLRSSGRSSLTSRSPRTSIAPCAGHGTKTRGNGNLGPQGGWRIGDPNSRRKVQERGTRPAVSYLRGSCREGRRGSATIPGLNVLPLSPYPSIQLGLLPLASPWKKFRRKRRKKKINHAEEKRQPYSAGGSSEPGGPVHLRHGRPVSPPPPTPLPGPALAIHHSLPRQCRSRPAPRRREPRPP